MGKINKLLREYLNEIDWEGDFKDVSKSCLSAEQLVKDLNAEIERLGIEPKNRPSLGQDKPIIPKSKMSLEGDKINVEAFIKDITTKPNTIFGKNEKMKKTDYGKMQFTINTGLPALVGIVYDEDEKKFYYVNTCPGAGACKKVCYARRGSYIRCPEVALNLTRRLNLLLNHPDEYEQMATNEIEAQLREFEGDIRNGMEIKLMIRWNDAGDFFTEKYFNIARKITKNFIDKGYNVGSYAYTKMGKYVNLADNDFITNFSREANKKEVEKVDAETTKASTIMPKMLFYDLFEKGAGNSYKKSEITGKTIFISKESPNILKQRVSKHYNVPIETLKYTWELPQVHGKPNEFNVIVLPSDSDEGAQRKDVKLSFLAIH